jgi:hypothetical protein
MSSIKQAAKAPEASAAIRKVFEEQMLPRAAALRAAGREFFPRGADPKAASYYTNRTKRTMTKADFRVPGVQSPEAFEKGLAELWKTQGYPELTPIAPPLAALAKMLYFVEERDAEVSPFMYVMF